MTEAMHTLIGLGLAPLLRGLPMVYTVAELWRNRARTRLVTHEDILHLHKILAGFCLLHFVWHLYTPRQLATPVLLTGAWWPDVALLLPHLLLPLSSFAFHLPRRRVAGQ